MDVFREDNTFWSINVPCEALAFETDFDTQKVILSKRIWQVLFG